MKRLKVLFTVAITSVMLSFCSAQEKVPQNVQDAFVKKFPTAKSVKWDKENDTEWEAEFKMDKMEYSANFMSNGTWKETEHEIAEKDIPGAVKQSLASNFAGYKIKEMEVSETAEGMVYEFEVKKGEVEMEVAIDASGEVVMKKMMKESDEEDND